MENDGSGENTDELLSADVDDDVDVFGLIPLALSHDCCDVLLDTIDSQLSHLQIHKQVHEERYESPILSCLDGNQSVSKDTGLGSSTFPTNEKTPSTPDWTRSEVSDEHVDHQSMRKTGATVTEVWLQNPEGDPSSLSSMSRVEQCRWRLEKLLGRNTEVAGIGNEEDDFTMNSVCTEDFSTRFRDEMLVLPTSGTQTEREVINIHNDRLICKQELKFKQYEFRYLYQLCLFKLSSPTQTHTQYLSSIKVLLTKYNIF